MSVATLFFYPLELFRNPLLHEAVIFVYGIPLPNIQKKFLRCRRVQ